MLTCVCRPVSGNLPKMPPNVIPIQKRAAANAIVVVTAEPKINVPGRLTSAELRAMALRQQQQIDSQHQLLATKEQRLRFLKSQEVRNAVANAEGERLRRLRERVEAQESKLRRLRALRGQVDLQKTYNVTLSNDLDSIRALFSEKEKELSLAVAKVEALTRQLEDLRRDRRCPLNLIAGANGVAQQLPPQASRELEKLRRELMYRNQLTLQQDARLHLQREALQQRQAELRSVDQRIYELQTRLQRKRAANIQTTAAQTQNHQLQLQQQQLQQQQQQHQQQQKHQQLTQQKQQHQQQQQNISTTAAYQSNLTKQGVAALKQQLLQKQQQQQQATTTNVQQQASKFSNIIAREQNRNIPRGNVAAVEPYIHTPQKSTITTTSSYLGVGNLLKHAAATANTNQQNQLIQDLTHVKLNLTTTTTTTSSTHSNNLNNQNQNFFSGAESDESKLAKKMLIATTTKSIVEQQQQKLELPIETTQHIYAEVGPKKRDLMRDAAAIAATTNVVATSNIDVPLVSSSNSHVATTAVASTTTLSSKIPKSIMVTTQAPSISAKLHKNNTKDAMMMEQEKKHDLATRISETMSAEKNTPQLTVHSMPLGTANKSVATGVSATNSSSAPIPTSIPESALNKPKPLQQQLPLGNLAVPPRKPISSVAPTSITSSIPKMITYSPKVNRVAPSIVTSATSSSSVVAAAAAAIAANLDRPALPPKPSKLSPSEVSSTGSAETAVSSATLPAKKLQVSNTVDAQSTLGIQTLNINDNLPIKAKPLTIRKQPLSEQPRLKSLTSSMKPPQQSTRKIDIPTASSFLFPDTEKTATTAPPAITHKDQTEEVGRTGPPETAQYSPNANSNSPNSISSASVDETDKMDSSQSEKSSPDSLKRRMRQNATNTTSCTAGSKPKLTRRVSFDPLALLLDASLEGELELVKKTAMQVANPSAANDEGITALHNAICAGHFDIVKFLVEFGCDVNAQDSDGWTPLHCAASCNNLSMVKFLVENGACLFASTLSDHETPAEKCEEDEEGFDGCSEYLYSIQEKLGILHGGEVYAVFSYEAQNSDELTFNVNERLVILRKGDDAESEWWWAKNEHNEEGYVPRNLLGLYPRVSPQNSNFND